MFTFRVARDVSSNQPLDHLTQQARTEGAAERRDDHPAEKQHDAQSWHPEE